jgi:5-methylcytosine-specific restriction endonuclease McrBC GTP-binding regulatory subunit McrB
MNENLYQLKEAFLNEWPLSRIENLQLEEYTNLNKTSFCYWLEAKTNELGSVWGGSSYKFGIYKRRDISTAITVDNRITDGEYAWFQKYGNTTEEAFQTIKNILISIINYIQNDELEKIDAIDLGDAYKWKIAFLYSNFNVVNIFKNESLLEAAQSFKYKGLDKSYAALNKFLFSTKVSDQDYFEFTSELWKTTSLANPKKYWIYAAGENAHKWNEFYEEGIMGLGWDDLGDLDIYDNKNEIKKKLQELENVESTKQNDTAANYDFHKVIKEGDIIIVKKGISELLGFGVITSEYFYDENRESYQKCRKVEWKLKGNWKVDFNLPVKTLTDVTKYPTDDPNYNKYYERLMAIMDNKYLHQNNKGNIKEEFIEWMIANKSGGNHFVNQFSSKRELLEKELDEYEEIYQNTFKNDLFKINAANFINQIEVIKKNIYDKSTSFYEYNKSHYTGRPSGILGNNNYLRFLNEYFSNQNTMRNTHPINTFPLNQILYGPPGTGKTYHTVLEAAKIVTGNENISYDDALNVFNTNLGTQIEFITFHQNYSYEDFIQGLRPDTENGSTLTFEKKDGVFKRIADRALKNLEASKNPATAKKDFDIVFQELIKPLNEGDVEELEIKMKKSSFYITEVGEKSIEFRKNIGDSNHTLSINTLRKMYEKGVNDLILGGLQPYYNPILQLLLENGKSNVQSVNKQNYVIIIDEINRANISRVFGELITLIEEDKRSHGKIPMRVTLPSGDAFIVPSNLYIIGTMNTADKSIALLDIALRRRFEFVPMYPDGTLEAVHDKEILSAINKAILERKNHDFTIGHAYFMGDDYSRVKTINNKVIPLLLEYFMNDEKEVKAIMQSAQLTVDGWPLKLIS